MALKDRNTPEHDPQTVLVAIDMQDAFATPSSAWFTEGYPEAQSQVRRLATQFRGKTIWTQFIRDPAEPGSWQDYYKRWQSFQLPPEAPDWELTSSPDPGDPIVTQGTFSKWTDGIDKLVNQDTHVIVCGVATDCCVLATVLDAVDDGVPVTVVQDACAGATHKAHKQAIDLLDLLSPMVQISTAEEVLRAQEP